MKKHKSVVSILLAIMMVFTFMPTLAFADTTAKIPAWVESGHHWDKGTETKKASNCYDYTLTEYKCEGELDAEDPDHLDCGASYVAIDYKGHDFGTEKPNYKNVTAKDFLAQVAKQTTAEEYKDFATLVYSKNYCYVKVPVCKTCGIFDLSNLKETADPTTTNYFKHEPANGSKPCAESFTCKYCGTSYPNPDYGKEGHTHNFEVGKEKLIGTYCSVKDLSSDAVAGGYSVYERTCTVCGKTERYSVLNGSEDNVEHDGIGTPLTTAPTADQQKYYVQYKGKWYAPNVVLPLGENDNPCTTEPNAALVCSKDNQEVGTCKVAAKGHNFETVTLGATCEGFGATLVICKDCGFVKEFTRTADATGHKYKVTVLAEPSCFADGISIAQCENCGVMEILNNTNHVARETAAGSTVEKVYYTGINGELTKTATADNRIEVADWLHKTHDYGKYEDMKEATCEKGVLQARKCAVCGLYDVHNTVETSQPTGHKWEKTTQDPTCGAKGFEYEICSVCGDVNYETRKEFGEPVVAFGTKCKMDKWVVETAATPFAEGTKKLVCSVCGDDGHIYMEGRNIKEGNVTRTSIAKTKIAAPKVKSLKKKAKVTVKAVAGATKYQILVNGKVSKTVKKAGTFTVKKGIKAGKKNKFQIRAINADGVKATSKAKSLKIKKK